MTHISFHQAMASCPIVASVRGIPLQDAQSVGEILVEAGVRVLEVTVRSKDTLFGDLPSESLRVIEKLINSFGHSAHVSASGVISCNDIQILTATGISTFFSPAYDPDVVKYAADRKLAFIPGVETVSEAISATLKGAYGLKLFPSAYHERDGRFHMRHTPGFVRYLSAFTPVPIIVSGDFPATQDLQEYQKAGAFGLNIGRHLYSEGVQSSELRARAARFVDIITRLED